LDPPQGAGEEYDSKYDEEARRYVPKVALWDDLEESLSNYDAAACARSREPSMIPEKTRRGLPYLAERTKETN
jgi:hypothetical protein